MTTTARVIPTTTNRPAEAPAAEVRETPNYEAALDELLNSDSISLGETIRMAMGSLMSNKLRTLLTALGVIIGVASVVALIAIGRGSQNSITSSITSNGANLLTVRSGASSQGGVRSAVGGSQTLTYGDAQALAKPENVPDALYVSPEYDGNAQIVAGSQNTNARVTGATSAYPLVHNITIADGEMLTDEQVASMSNVVVLGANVATTLFPDGDAVGQTIRISGQSFKVTGVLTAKGGTGFGSVDDGILIPITTAQRKLFGGRAVQNGEALVSSVAVQAASAEQITAAQAEITALLRERHNLPSSGTSDDFNVLNQQDILNSVIQTTNVLTMFLSAIAAISLIVGGIGIMNIMLVSVRERTREIGLRKAIGAREQDILMQFLIESLILSVMGGVIGLALGIGLALLVNLSGSFTAAPSWDAALLAIGFSMAIGLFFGIEPARRAARLNPIEALRYD